MRSLLLALTAGLMALCGPATAQDVAGDNLRATVIMLQTGSAAERQRIVRQVERAPGAYAPMVLLAMVDPLAELGRTEDALRWRYFALIRLQTDLRLMSRAYNAGAAQTESMFGQLGEMLDAQLGTTRFTVTAAQRRTLLDEAIRLEERTPRQYGFGEMFGSGGMMPTTWPATDAIAVARFASVAAVRAQLEGEITRDAALAAIEAEIAAGRPAGEAASIIPEQWRDRIQPLRTVRIDSDCQAMTLRPTPRGAQPAGFVSWCEREYMIFAPPNTERRLRWFAADTLSPIGDVLAPQPTWRGDIVVRGGSAQALFTGMSANVTTAVMVGVDGSVRVMSSEGGVGMVTMVSPSGRYGLRTTSGGADVVDFETNTTLFRRERGNESPVYERSQLIAETTPGHVEIVTVRRALQNCVGMVCPVEVLSLDADGRERRLNIPNAARAHALTSYGDTQATIDVVAPQPSQTTASPSVETYATVEEYRAAQERLSRDAETRVENDVAVIDLAAMRVEWTGPRDQMPPPRGVTECSPNESPLRFEMRDLPRSERRFMSPQGSFTLQEPARGGGVDCAVSGDGRYLVVIASPYLHHYAITAP